MDVGIPCAGVMLRLACLCVCKQWESGGDSSTMPFPVGGRGQHFWWFEHTNVDGTYDINDGDPELQVRAVPRGGNCTSGSGTGSVMELMGNCIERASCVAVVCAVRLRCIWLYGVHASLHVWPTILFWLLRFYSVLPSCACNYVLLLGP